MTSLDTLLSIDVEAEIRKVAGAGLHGRWQLPTEWVRRAFAARARQVSVTTRGGRIWIEDDGTPIDGADLRRLAALLDGECCSAEARHEALAALEGAGQVALLALVGLGLRSIAIQSRSGHEPSGLRLRWRRGGRATIEPTAGGIRRTRIELGRSDAGGRRALAWLRRAGRFAPLFGKTIEIDGHALPPPPLPALAEAIEDPVRALIGLPADDGSGQLWILAHGIVGDHAVLARPPFFDAVVEIGGGGRETPLRDRAAALTPALAARYAEALARQAARIGTLPARGQAALSIAILRAAREPALRGLLLGAPCLPALCRAQAGEPVAARWLALDDLPSVSRAGPASPLVLQAVDSAADQRRFVLDEIPTLVLMPTLRALLVELLPIDLRAPPRLARSFSAGALRAQVAGAARRLLARAFRPSAVPDRELGPGERLLLDTLRPIAAADGHHVYIGRRGRSPRFAVGAHVLPREAPAVRAAIAALTTDPLSAYPAAMALFEASPPSAGALRQARERWRRARRARRPE